MNIRGKILGLGAGLAWLLFGCGGGTDRPGLAPSTAPSKAIEEPSGPIVVDADAGAPDAAPRCIVIDVNGCGPSATFALSCGPGAGAFGEPTVALPAVGCWPLGFGDWDGGGVAGKYCCR